METLLNVVLIVFSIFQIILFFKIWIMSNDVNDIKNNLSKNEKIIQIKVLAIKGEKDKAKEMLDELFIYEICSYKGYRENKQTYYEFFDSKELEYGTIYSELKLEAIDFYTLRENSENLLS